MTTTHTVSRVSLKSVISQVEPADAGPRKEMRIPAELKHAARKRMAVAAAGMLAVIGLIASLASFTSGTTQKDQSLIYFTVRKTDLPIAVTERGTLESQKNVQVICEVDDIHGDGIYGTPILWIVENGSSVEEGDLVVELDSSSHLERLDQQILATEQAQAAKYLQARSLLREPPDAQRHGHGERKIGLCRWLGLSCSNTKTSRAGRTRSNCRMWS